MNNLKDQDTDGRLLLNGIFHKVINWMWTGNNPSGCAKYEDFVTI